MCVIAFSPKGVDIPTTEQLKQMWEHNPDGAGYAFVGNGGKVFYRKGFMTLDKLLADLKNPERFKNTNFAIHFRIGTSGKNDNRTCHPFPISNSYGDLVKTEGMAESVLFHNGVIADGGLVNEHSSDTQDFVVALSPMIKKYNRSKARDYFIEQLIEGNRLLIMYKNNAFKMYGEWKKDGELWVSNLYYKSDYSWSGTSYYKDYYEQNWWDDWYEEQHKKQVSKYLTSPDETATGISEETAKIFADIIAKGYMFLEDNEITMLANRADDYTTDHIEYAGYSFGYDKEQGVVWLESEPEPILPLPETTDKETENDDE